MKNKFLSLILTFVCVVTCGIALSGCGRKMDRYLAVVPTDRDYSATLNHHLETSNGNYDHSWRVMRKNVNFCGQDRTVIYVEYSLTDNNNHYYDVYVYLTLVVYHLVLNI